MPELAPRLIQDPVYGEIEISEPVLLELLECPTMQRTKRINQLGTPDEYHHLKGFKRFDHCVGAMILTGKLGASEEEQAASLLHDASHTAFSHMIDWLVGSESKADYQDSIHDTFLRRSEVPEILEKHGLTLESVTNYHNFSLLEQDMPLLCADRVDYGLREMLVSGFAPEVVPGCVDSLTTFGGRIVFSNFEAARNFGYGFMKLQNEDWGSIKSMRRYVLFASILRGAIGQKIISMNDFLQDDEYVMNRILNSGGEDFKVALDSLKHPFEPLGITVHHKFRYVDPEIYTEGKLTSLMTEDPEYKAQVFYHREISQAGVVL